MTTLSNVSRLLGAGFFAALCASSPEIAADDAPVPVAVESCDGRPSIQVRPDAIVGTVQVDPADVFDNDDDLEDGYLYRFANALHINTRQDVIQQRLLVKQGDHFVPRLVRESERILRRDQFIYDARICVAAYAKDEVDLRVDTRDAWTLEPDIAFGRKGGVNTGALGLREHNLLGRGIDVHLGRIFDVNRDALTFGWSSRYVGKRQLTTTAQYANASDGRSYTLGVGRPFYALDTARSWGVELASEQLVHPLYDAGVVVERFEKTFRHARAYAGFSSGLHAGSVRRVRFGIEARSERFRATQDTVDVGGIPNDRTFVYPFVEYQWLQDRYRKVLNQDQIGRTEDVLLGSSLNASVGLSPSALGSTDDALLFSSAYYRGFDLSNSSRLFVSSELSGRITGRGLENGLIEAQARYFHRFTPRSVAYAALQGSASRNLNRELQLALGGDSGLRGYPLRYQAGRTKASLTLEQRLYLDWYPFRLYHVGVASFFDAGRTWGRDAYAGPPHRWLADVGVGLRLANARSAGRVIHIDVAFPLVRDHVSTGPQLLITTQVRF